MNPVKKILAPIALSTDGFETVRFAADLARRYEASLTILHVYQPALSEGHALARPTLPTLLIEAARQLAAAKHEALAAGLREVEMLLVPGGIAEEIVRLARDQAYDLIVMGTSASHGCDRMLFGSVSETVLRTAPCPLVSIRLSAGGPRVAEPAQASHDFPA